MVLIEIIIPEIQRRVFVNTSYESKIADVLCKLKNVLDLIGEWYLVTVEGMELLTEEYTVGQAGITTGSRVLLCNKKGDANECTGS